jgi:thiol-disulfide isomerase/thioredoxin
MQLQFETNPWEVGGVAEDAERILIGFFSPTCGICAPLMPAFQSLADNAPAGEAVVLASDAEFERSREYLAAKKVSLPFVAESGALKQNRIEGAPFAAVVDRAGVVLAAGGVNTLEHVEWLLKQARHAHSVQGQLDPSETAGNGHVAHAALEPPEVVGREES